MGIYNRTIAHIWGNRYVRKEKKALFKETEPFFPTYAGVHPLGQPGGGVSPKSEGTTAAAKMLSC
jgi:hypothetical protein